MVEMEQMRFREVRAEHIMKMLQASADDDDRHLFDVDWTVLPTDARADLGELLVVGADAKLEKALRLQLIYRMMILDLLLLHD